MSPEVREALLRAPARFTHRLVVAPDDVDAAGFVFFARICSFFDRAYVELRKQSGGTPEALRATRVVSTEADFLRPLRAGDAVEVAIVTSSRAEERTTLGFRVTAGTTAAAIGHVVYAGSSPIELPTT